MKLAYFNNCVNWDLDKVETEDGLCEMIDTGEDITLEDFASQVDVEDWETLQEELGYVQSSNEGMTIAQDYHVRFQKGTLAGIDVVWMIHSAIEYVFAPRTFSY